MKSLGFHISVVLLYVSTEIEKPYKKNENIIDFDDDSPDSLTRVGETLPKITIVILPFSREPAGASFLWQSEGISGEDVWANPDKEGV